MNDSLKHPIGSSDGLWDHAPELVAPASSEKPTDEQWKQIDRLRLSVDESSKYITTRLSTFIILSIYVAITVGNTTDEMLFKRGDLPLPLLDVGLPIKPFYFVLPLFFLMMHMYVIVQLRILKAKLVDFKRAVLDLNLTPEQKNEQLRLSYPFVFNHLFLKTGENRTVRFIFRFAVVTVLVVLPIILLLWLQRQFLAIHIVEMTWWHRACVLGDLVMLLMYWPRPREPRALARAATSKSGTKKKLLLRKPMRRAWRQTILRVRHPIVIVRAWLAQLKKAWRWIRVWPRPPVATCSLFVFFVSIFVLTIPDEWTDVVLPQTRFYWYNGVQPFGSFRRIARVPGRLEWVRERMVSWFQFKEESPPGWPMYLEAWIDRNLDLSDKTLVNAPPPPEIMGALMHKGQKEWDILGEHSTPITLPDGTDLRYADFSNARLPRAFLGSAILWSANFRYARLKFHSWLVGAQLQGANLYGSVLHDTQLLLADLHVADLKNAELHGANLQLAKLHGADLRASEFRGADLKYAELYGANLYEAKFKGMNLYEAKLQGANLYGAKIQGTDFSSSKLQGTILRKSSFIACVFEFARMACSDLDGASFGLCDLREVRTEPLDPKDSETIEAELRKAMTNDAEELSEILKRLGACYPLFKNEGFRCTDCLVDDDPNLPFAHCNPNRLTEDQFNEKYAKKLAELACEDPYVAKAIAVRTTTRIYATVVRDQIVAKTLLAAISDSCEPVKNLPKDVLDRLFKVAAEGLVGPPDPSN